MWPFQRPSTRGLSTDQRERLIQALEEQNTLLRLQLEAQGIRGGYRRQGPTEPIRKRTASDVTVVTRDVIAEEQARVREAKRLKDSPG